MTAAPLLQLDNVSKRFGRRSDVAGRLLERLKLRKPPPITTAVDDVSLSVYPGEVVGLVGESGCGKSTLGRIAASLLEPSAGAVRIDGVEVSRMNKAERSRHRLRIQMVFQNPYASLNPRMRVSDIVGESPYIHGLTTRRERDQYVATQLERAGLNANLRTRFPHQFSGGQRQRIGIARALAVNPDMLVCDEAVAALDVSIQAQILNLFMDLRQDLGLTYLFISHDLSVVRHLCDRVLIMYLGRIVESARAQDIFVRPNHPYTQALLAQIPRINDRKKEFHAIKGEIPSPLQPPAGCHFHPRCPYAMDRCRIEAPVLKEISSGHSSACHLNDNP